MQYKEGTNVIFGIELTYEILKNEADELLFEATLMGTEVRNNEIYYSRRKSHNDRDRGRYRNYCINKK